MGRVTSNNTEDFKGHKGLPTNPADFNSIEEAIRGTLVSPPNGFADFIEMRNFANWNMLDEVATAQRGAPILRGQQPTSYNHFAGYPKPTVNLEIPFIQVDEGGGGAMDIRLILPYGKVGFSFTVDVLARIGTNLNNNITRQLIFNEGQTVSTTNFEWPGIFSGSQEWYVQFLNSSHSIYEFSNRNGVVSSTSTTPIGATSYSFISVLGFSCYTPSAFGQRIPGTLHYWTGGFGIGSTVRYATGQPVINETWIEQNGNFIYTTVNGVVTQFSYCIVD